MPVCGAACHPTNYENAKSCVIVYVLQSRRVVAQKASMEFQTMNARMFQSIHNLASLLLAIIAACFALYDAHAEDLSTQDTPIQIVNDPVLDWSVGNGLIYWSTNCQGEFAGESAELHRRPVNSGVVRTIATINNPSKCRTFFNQLSSSDGLYYFDDSEARIERIPLSQPYSAVAIKALALAEFPSYRRNLIESGDYL